MHTVFRRNATPGPWSDERLEQIIGNLLRVGVLLAAAVVLAGGILYLFQHGSSRPEYHSFRGEPPAYRSVSGAVVEALHFHSRGIIQVGLILLIATPIARVIFSAAGFGFERDYMYVVITLVVLAILLYSLITGG